MFLDAANGNGHADAFFGPGTRVVAEIEINDEEEEDEIEEFEDEEVAPTPPPFSPASDGRYDGIVGNSDDELV
jgi:hypothetical protein